MESIKRTWCLERTIWVLITVVLLGSLIISCTRTTNEPIVQIDVVNDIEPVNTWATEKSKILDELKDVPIENRQSHLKANWPTLSHDLVLFLKRKGKIDNVALIDSIVYKYGSAKNVTAEDKEGKIHEGVFNNQLVAFMYITGEDENKPMMTLVACTNGMFRLPEDALSFIDTDREFFFTIEKGQGIASYVSTTQEAIYLAEYFDLQLYKGRKMYNKYKITPDEARQILRSYKKTQITVNVEAGWVFDLESMTLSK